MRVLLATDGSPSADIARALIASLEWPRDAVVRVVSIPDESPVVFTGSMYAPPSDAIDAELGARRERAREIVEEARQLLASAGLATDGRVLRGRPAGAIIDEAGRWEADLIVAGSRGHSRIASVVLGSTSAELVDHAPCPVLVARDRVIESVVLAADGSPGAQAAEAVLTQWPIFRDLPISVVTVGPVPLPFAAGIAPGMSEGDIAAYVRSVEADADESRAVADATLDRLAAAGLRGIAHVRQGSVAAEIIEFAEGRPHALVVTGSRGLGGLARLVLGSVARSVLYHAPGSVLIVRRDVAVRPHAAAREPVASA
jgi:nucleotide-binding universal stress UspA family protein